MDKGIEKVLEKYRKALAEHTEYDPAENPDSPFSKEYTTFKKEALTKTVSNYENYCNSAARIFKISPKPKERKKLLESIEISHLDITPEGAIGLSILSFIFIMFISIILALTLFLATGELKLGFPLLLLILGIFLIKPISNYPNKLANQWRLKAGNQMVLCILYIVMYMRHTPNLEHAIKFAGEHLGAPLNLDMRKILWDIETGKYSTIQESLNNYLKKWRSTNIEFIESFNLIKGSLQQSGIKKREQLLEKALQIVLEGTYDRMMHYAHNLKNPITILHMLGIILPILGLIILPLMGTFLGVRWYHLAIMYNVLLPTIVWYYGNKILLERPSGYGEREDDNNPIYRQFSENPEAKAFSLFIIIIFLLIGFLPLIMHLIMPAYDINLGKFGNFLDYKDSSGPFGVGAALLGLFVPLGLAIGIGTYYKQKTKQVIKIRDQTKKLELEFAGSLFQLGNKIGDGIPAEIAFEKVGQTMKGTNTGKFFSIVNMNIRKLGMDVRNAIFNQKTGAILYFPSTLIESSMKILVQGIKKGPLIVSKSLISISTYFNRLHKINERIKDLLADIISSMKGQINFLAPMIAGITVGIGTMITTILGKLSLMVGQTSGEELGSISDLVSIFPVEKMMPPFFFQLVVGIYVLQVVWILTSLSNGIENGVDKIKGQNSLGKNLNKSLITYTLIAMIVMIVFSLLAGVIANIEVLTQ